MEYFAGFVVVLALLGARGSLLKATGIALTALFYAVLIFGLAAIVGGLVGGRAGDGAAAAILLVCGWWAVSDLKTRADDDGSYGGP